MNLVCGYICIFFLVGGVMVEILQSVDISALCVHPACVVSVTLTTLRAETGRSASKEVESIMLNVSGRLLMVQREQNCRQGDDSLVGKLSSYFQTMRMWDCVVGAVTRLCSLITKELWFRFMTVVRDFSPSPKHPDQDEAHPASFSVYTAGFLLGGKVTGA
jgi:hypothetical protein